jgi:hypothetical protein
MRLWRRRGKRGIDAPRARVWLCWFGISDRAASLVDALYLRSEQGIVFPRVVAQGGFNPEVSPPQSAIIVNQTNNIAMLRKGASRCTSLGSCHSTLTQCQVFAFPSSSGGLHGTCEANPLCSEGSTIVFAYKSNKEAIGARLSLLKKTYTKMPRKRQYQPTNQPTTTSSSASSTNLRDQKPRRLPPRLIAIQEMPRRNNQRAPANIVRQATVNLDPIVGKLRNPAAVLRVLGVPKQHDALDLLADRRAELRDRVAHHRGALAVAAGDDGGSRAFGRGEREEALGFVDRCARGARG